MHKTKMINRYILATPVIFSALLVYLLIQIPGCKSPDPAAIKQKVDENVYQMIDQKWQDDFGVKANYRIDKPSPNDVSTEKYLAPGTILTLPEAVAIATDHNRVYQLEKENLYIKALDLRLARHEFDPILFGTANADYVKDGADEGVTAGGGIGAEQLLTTGATVGVNLTAAWVDIITGNARSGLAHIFTFVFEQPLLKGSDPNIVLENLTQAERDLLYQVRSFNRFRKKFVVTTIEWYYTVLQAYDTAENARENYNTMASICAYTEKLADVGRVPRFEVDQAEQDKLIAWDAYVQAKKNYKQALDEFKLTLGVYMETEIQLDYNELTSLRGIEMKMPEFSEMEAIETAIANRLDLANAFDAIRDAERKVFVAIDNLKPDLRLVAAVERQGRTDPLTLGRSKDTSLVGLQFDPNFDKVSQENDFRFALIVVDQNQRGYEEKMETIILDVREAYRDLAEAAERYKVQTEQLTLAKQRFDKTLLMLQYGRRRVNTRDVLDAQKDLYRAQDEASKALINYMVSMLRFYRDVEILQVRPDGMWQI